MYKYYVPFYYLILSRLKSNIDRVSWIIIFIIPPFIIGFSYSKIDFSEYIFIFILANLAFYSLYEIGYLENDIQTTKKEKNPTIRIKDEDYNYLNTNYFKVISIKYIMTLFLVTLLFFVIEDNLMVVAFIFILFVSRIFFYLHNFFRNRVNILTFFILAVTKYIMILFLLMPFNELFVPILLSILIFPLLRTIEHSSRKKYNLIKYSKIIGNHDLFRLKYYIFLIIVSLFFGNKLMSIILGYFFFFRLFSYLLIRKKIYKRDDLKTKDIREG